MKARRAGSFARQFLSRNARTAERSARTTLLLALACPCVMALAAPPSLETLFPCGAKAGTTTLITATGKGLDKMT